MKYLKIAFLIALVLLLLIGCGKDTTLINENGNYYLQFNQPTAKPIMIGCVMAPELRFRNTEEMLRTIRSGRFTKAQMDQLIDFDWDEQGRVILFDLDHVVEPVCPGDYEGMSVIWTGDHYSFLLYPSSNLDDYDSFIISQEQYHLENIEHYQKFDEYRECEVTTKSRNGVEVTIFDYSTNNSDAYGNFFITTHRLCTYTLTDENTELFVVEYYDPKKDLQTPEYIALFGKTEYGYFRIHVDDFTALPSAQWLLSFDLKPYNWESTTNATPVHYDNAYYSIHENDGKFILTPKEPPEDPSPALSASRALYHPTFTSIAEMQQGIIAGPISKHELFALCITSQSENGEVEICNPNRLYECTAPEEFNLQCITWYRTNYAFSLSGNTAQGFLYCYNQESYEESFSSHYQDFLTDAPETITRQTWTPNRFATVYYLDTGMARLKYVCYEISVGDRKMYIQEKYLLEHQDPDEPVSDQIPTDIEFWGTEDDRYFYGQFFDFTERPTVGWLSRFGLMPYQGET